jgi:hypothetical protein
MKANKIGGKWQEHSTDLQLFSAPPTTNKSNNQKTNHTQSKQNNTQSKPNKKNKKTETIDPDQCKTCLQNIRDISKNMKSIVRSLGEDDRQQLVKIEHTLLQIHDKYFDDSDDSESSCTTDDND